MNYEGCVSSINTLQWTFIIDHKITVHMGHLAARNKEQLLPEIGEKIKIYNAHYKSGFNNALEKLFLCDKSTLICNFYKKYAREDKLLSIILDYNLGVSDLLEIDYNISVISEFIQELSSQTDDEIILEVIRCLAGNNGNEQLNEHCCLNRIIPQFTLKTVSKCCYVDLQTSSLLNTHGPQWFFGSHSKTLQSDILIGHLQVNKRYGMILLYDSKHQMPCLITGTNTAVKRSALNKFILIKEYRIFTEIYKEANVPNFEYLIFDIKDVVVLDVASKNISIDAVLDELPNDFPYVYDFECVLLRNAPVSVRDSAIECWLEIFNSHPSKSYNSYLGLNAYQMRIVPFINGNESFHIYHSEKLKDCKNIELQRLKPHTVCQIFTEKTAIFVLKGQKYNDIVTPVLSVPDVLDKLKDASDCISFQGLLKEKKLTPSLSSRTLRVTKVTGFGTPGTFTHSLLFTDDSGESKLLLYLNNWENLQIPLGLIIDMRICVRNVLAQKNKYLKSTAMTTFEILGYEPAVFFDTVNLSTNIDRPCDKYSYLGLGDLLPCNILIWSCPIQLYIRSVKIWCTNNIIATSITLFVADEMGQALVISKSTELLRLLLGLQLHQWTIWCEAFENVREYVHDNEEVEIYSQDHDVNIFIQALAFTLKIINVIKINALELNCRKMESSSEDNEGMPKWFCINARHCDTFS